LSSALGLWQYLPAELPELLTRRTACLDFSFCRRRQEAPSRVGLLQTGDTSHDGVFPGSFRLGDRLHSTLSLFSRNDSLFPFVSMFIHCHYRWKSWLVRSSCLNRCCSWLLLSYYIVSAAAHPTPLTSSCVHLSMGKTASNYVAPSTPGEDRFLSFTLDCDSSCVRGVRSGQITGIRTCPEYTGRRSTIHNFVSAQVSRSSERCI